MTLLVGLAGITGQFGQLLASKLLSNNQDVSIRGFCRNQTKVDEHLASSSQIEIIEGGAYDRERAAKFVKGCDIVVCCYLGDDDLMIEGQKVLIDACEDEKVPRYMASDWCLDYTKLEFGQLFTKDPMKRVKAYLETKEFVNGVYVLIRAFLEVFFSPYFGIYDSKTNTFSHWGEPGVLFECTSYGNTAEFTAQAILDKEAVGVKRCAYKLFSTNFFSLRY
ncbi:hypothetical protein NW768_011770 [Fusarium equiseti]|uniref:NAD(P)-binding domain-containing protein n=1 Tax=Fusarium equiseti TaxID=61235 RepID=A0ABQ8QWD4_FUSEQ|nr:hypothetical protein NW768_011770 [Fusarium equiseti]